jgi:hypothetical protein
MNASAPAAIMQPAVGSKLSKKDQLSFQAILFERN